MIRSCFAAALAATLTLPTAGCKRQDPSTVTLPANDFGRPVAYSGQTGSPQAASTTAASNLAPAVPATAAFSATTAFAPSGDRDPVVVLANWAKSIELKDWRTVRAYWGDSGARSGLGNEAFEKRWSRLHEPRVTLGKGQQEGAAGSLYYTAPVRIDDSAHAIKGTVTLRRVNDVPGASRDQLRWHIESSTLPL